MIKPCTKWNIVISLCALLWGCQKNNKDIEYSLPTPEGLIHWDILKVEGRKLVSVHDTLRLDVYCPRTTSCDYITHLVPDEHGTWILIKAFGNTYKDSPCLMFAVPQVVQFKFVPKRTGVFTLKFIKKDETVINYIVRVK